jgi:hypothetical protein
MTTGSNNIIIGNTGSASSATVSNEITLGNGSITRFRIPGLTLDTAQATNGQVAQWNGTGFTWTSNIQGTTG